jgi:hypothetical protein
MNLGLRARSALAAVLASTALVVFAAPALAAPPANDNLADAVDIGSTLPITGIAGTTVDATGEPGEPSHRSLNQPFQSVWYALNVPAEGDYADIVTVSTCPDGSFNGDYVEVYAVGGPGPGGLIRQSQFLSETSCKFTFVVTEGTQYRIAVDRAADGGAAHELSVAAYEPPPGPANDDLADAQEIGPGLPIEGILGTNANATPEIGEPAHGNSSQANSSVWYALDVPEEGDYPDVVTVNTCGEFNPGNNYVGVYAVVGEGFAGLVRQDPAASEDQCAFTFAVTEGTDYRIAVDNLSGGEEFELSVAALDPPSNDDFEDRQVIPSELPQEIAGSTIDASTEEDEPQHGDRGPQRSVWYEWTSDVDAPVKIDACESESEFGFRPEIAVYVSGSEGPAIFDLDRFARNEGEGCTLVFDPANAGGGEGARIAETPVTFYIAVDGLGHETEFTLDLALANPPANDDFEDRQTIPSTLPQTLPGTTFDAGAEAGEPEHSGEDAYRSVWYEWTGVIDGAVKIDVCDAEFDQPAIAVYGGAVLVGGDPDLADLTQVGGNFGNGCTLVLDLGEDAVEVTLYIVIDSGPEEEGDFNLNFRIPSPPANDDFADASELGPGLPVSVVGTIVDATAEEDEPSHGGEEHSVWYTWTPDVTQTVHVHTCASSFESEVVVYTGSSFQELEQVSGDDGCPGSSDGEKVTFEATAGTPYWIVVDGEREGAFTLGIQAPGTPPGPPTMTGVSPASGSDDNDPRLLGNAEAGSSVEIYKDPACEDVPIASGTAEEFASPGIHVHVDDDTTTTYYARAANVDGESGCSTTSVTYSEVTPDPPAAPAFTGSSPASGADDNDPELKGTAEPGSTVRIFTNAGCTSAVAGEGSAELFAGAGITVHVADNTTTSFYATAQNAAGTSLCSPTPLSYQEVTGSTPPAGGGQPPVTDPGPGTVKCPKGKVLRKGKCVKKKRKKRKK